MTYDELSRFLHDPTKLEAHHLNDLMMLSTQYPYCAPLHHLILTCLHRTGDLRFASELHKRILYITDPKELFFTLQDIKAPQAKIIRPEEMPHETQSSFDLISGFLEDHPDDASDIEQMIDHLHSGDPQNEEEEEEEEEEKDPTEIIEAFLNKGEEAEIIIPEEAENPADKKEKQQQNVPRSTPNTPKEDELFTETLARIYIRQGKYDQALRIFKTLNLNYSKKNSYFAEQIAFLEKLIRNSAK